MAIKAIDVIQDEDVEAVLEERTQQMYQFRRAFRDHDATDVNSGSHVFPQAVDNVRSAMDEVAEGSTYPETSLNYEGITADYEKEGFIIRVSDEAVEDSNFDVVLDATEEMGIAYERRQDQKAFNLLSANLNSSGPIGSGTNDMNFTAVVDAYTQLVEDEFVPADFEVYVSADAFGDLAKDSQFNRATDQGDALARQGQLGEAFGVNIAMTNTGDLADNEGIMVDTGRYGYESTRMPQEIDSEYDFDQDETKYKVRTRNDYVVMKDQAGIKIDGGV